MVAPQQYNLYKRMETFQLTIRHVVYFIGVVIIHPTQSCFSTCIRHSQLAAT